MHIVKEIGQATFIYVYHPVGGWNPCMMTWMEDEHVSWNTGMSYARTKEPAELEALSWAYAEGVLLELDGVYVKLDSDRSMPSLEDVREFIRKRKEG